MTKKYTSLGLMSGTSGDGVDASVIVSNGSTYYEVILDKYYAYDEEIFQNIHNLKQKINQRQDLEKNFKDINSLEKKITLFHAKVVKDITDSHDIDLVGFHGQTIYHNSDEKITKQIGNGNLLSQLIKKNIVYNFRENDIKNGGEGAPLASLFHLLILKQNNINIPSCILNIGGISNITIVKSYNLNDFSSRDIGPGNCLIDSWVRFNSKNRFDKDGGLAKIGANNEIILEQAEELYSNRINKKSLSFDVNDFDISFARGLSLEDGAATLTDFTSKIIGSALINLLPMQKNKLWNVLVSGGGRKNKTLIDKIKKMTLKKVKIQPIDDYGVNGDFVESQAFAFLAIRSFNNEPISFPQTTGVEKPCIGGSVIKIK